VRRRIGEHSGLRDGGGRTSGEERKRHVETKRGACET